MKRIIALTLIMAAGALSGCGGRQALKPAEGARPVPVARGATEAESAQELMTPSTQSRPERNAELLKKSTERPDDPFDLPPQGR